VVCINRVHREGRGKRIHAQGLDVAISGAMDVGMNSTIRFIPARPEGFAGYFIGEAPFGLSFMPPWRGVRVTCRDAPSSLSSGNGLGHWPRVVGYIAHYGIVFLVD
jgi:hypothetical protein